MPVTATRNKIVVNAIVSALAIIGLIKTDAGDPVFIMCMGLFLCGTMECAKSYYRLIFSSAERNTITKAWRSPALIVLNTLDIVGSVLFVAGIYRYGSNFF